MLNQLYQDFFYQAEMENIQPFIGAPKDPSQPITSDEVEKAVRKLNNCRAAGEDNITGEYFKYGAPALIEPIAQMFNKMFKNQQSIDALLTFIIISLNKQGKPTHCR